MVLDPRGVFHPQSGSTQIRSSLLTILMTNRYERVMENDFGANLNEFLFEQSGTAIENAVRQRIIDAINRYEPRVTIEDILVTTNPTSDVLAQGDQGLGSGQILYVKIMYRDPDNIVEVQDLTLELPLNK
jgi:phage baseplate assembly protein W